jgi:hypothetical protein
MNIVEEVKAFFAFVLFGSNPLLPQLHTARKTTMARFKRGSGKTPFFNKVAPHPPVRQLYIVRVGYCRIPKCDYNGTGHVSFFVAYSPAGKRGGIEPKKNNLKKVWASANLFPLSSSFSFLSQTVCYITL